MPAAAQPSPVSDVAPAHSAPGALLLSLCLSSPAQEGTARRIGLGDALGTSAGGVPQYREDTAAAWSSPNFANERWAVEYGSTWSAAPWAVVLQASRTNAGFNAAANQLTLDLNGGTYTVRPFLVSGSPRGGRVIVSDRLASGAHLRVTNGTFDNAFGSNSATVIGEAGTTGRLLIENGLYRAHRVEIGRPAGARGSVILDAGGRLAVTSRVILGIDGHGQIELRGPASELSAESIELGTGSGSGSVVLSDPTALLHVTGDFTIKHSPTDAGAGLRVQAGTARIDGGLFLALPTGSTGVATIEGGTVAVGGGVSFGDAAETTGAKMFLRNGRLEVTAPDALVPAGQRQFYWENGTIRFTGQDVALAGARLADYTRQGGDHLWWRPGGGLPRVGPGD